MARISVLVTGIKVPIGILLESAGSVLIIAEALKDDPRPLHVAFLGPLTDMASALLESPVSPNTMLSWFGSAAVNGPGEDRSLTCRTTSTQPTSCSDRKCNYGRFPAPSTKEWR
jgi:hypothetical protein